MSHNKRLKKLFEQVDNDIDDARTQDDLLSVIDKLRTFNGPLKFQTTTWKIAAIGMLLAAGGICFWALREELFNLNSPWLYVTVVLGVIAATLGYISDRLDKSHLNYRDKIFKKDVMFDNQLTHVQVSPSEYVRELNSRFLEFDRGNHACYVKNVLRGPVPGRSQDNDKLEVYTLYYVDQRTETTVMPDGNGGTTTQVRVVHDNYYRYGIIIPFSSNLKLGILSDQPNSIFTSSFSPSSLRFSKQYKACGTDEHQLSRFLSPQTVLAFEEMAKKYDSFNFELDGQGHACLSVKEISPLNVTGNSDFDDLDAFYEEIAGCNQPPVLLDLVAFADKLEKSLGNNTH